MTSPQVSVIVPAFALPHEISAFLEAMLQINPPKGLADPGDPLVKDGVAVFGTRSLGRPRPQKTTDTRR